MVDRFTITAAEQDPWIDADPSGQWVRYSDYAALEAQLAEARKALDALDRMSRGVDWCDQDEQARRWSAARRALEGGENG